MRGLGFLLFIVAIQVIAAIVQHRKKQAEKKAKEEAARQRAMAQLGLPTDPTGAVSIPTAGQQTVPASADLEERRRAQLEQLRLRREGRRAGVAIPQAGQSRRGVAIPTQNPQRGQPVMVATTIGTSDESRVKAQDADRRAREAERARKQQMERLAAQAQQAEDQAARTAYESSFHAVAGEADAAAHGVKRQSPVTATLGVKKARPVGAVAASGLAARLQDPASLRDAVMLREILDRPVGLR